MSAHHAKLLFHCLAAHAHTVRCGAVWYCFSAYPSSAAMITLPGYDIRSQVFENHQTRVYRGIRQSDGEPTIIKILNKQYPISEEVARFTRQHDLLQLVHHPNIVQSFGTERYGNAPALVMRDIGAVALTSILLDDAKPLDIKPFLELAIQVAEGLSVIHTARILHKDLCPNNIIVTDDLRTAQIIDMSISSRLSREQAPNLTPHQLEGTLAYIAPEQTGRMNRVIDARSDLYSLGATFYTMLTGETLFPAYDPVELVHSHIARVPKRVDEVNPDVPAAVADIIAMLLRKNPEDRIQTALGLKIDLETCLEALQSGTPLQGFQPGKNDMVSELRIPQKLYGRGEQVRELLSSFERATTQKPEIMLVSGYSGIGKTALVNEIHKPIMRERGYFTQGKFDQFTRTVPYSALVSALGGLIRQILTEPEIQLQAWRKRLLEVLGVNGGIITDLVPEAALLLGSPPPVAEAVDSQASQYRFQNVVLKFLQALSGEGQPLVMFLDDMQWADAATLSLVQQWMASPQTHHLLMICAYRDNEVSAAHPFLQMLEVLRERSISIHEIRVVALSVGDIAELLHDTLHITTEDDRNAAINLLAREILKKTGGNPFFIQQLLRTFDEREIIRFDATTHRWLWKHEDVVAADITENVVELVANTLKAMPLAMREILSFAACLGNSVEVDVLMQLCRSHFQYDTTTMLDSLLQAIESGFLQVQQGQFNTLYNVHIGAESEISLENFSTEKMVRCKFSHDRIQQVAYSLIDSQDLPKIHLFIGRFFMGFSADNRSVFEMVRHLNAGVELMTEYSERTAVAKLNVEAAKQANTASAFASGYEYAQKSIELFGEEGWQNDKSAILQAFEQGMASVWRMGLVEVIEGMAKTVRENTQSVEEYFPIESIRIQFYSGINEFLKACRIAEDLINDLGYPMPRVEKIGLLRVLWSFLKLEQAIKKKSIKELEAMNPASSLRQANIMECLGLLFIATVSLNIPVSLYMIFEALYLSLQWGFSESTPGQWVAYMSTVILRGDIERAYSYRSVVDAMVQRLGKSNVQALASVMLSFTVVLWKQHFSEASELMAEGYRCAMDVGDTRNASTALSFLTSYEFVFGDDIQNSIKKTSAYLESIETMGENEFRQTMLAYFQALHNLEGESEFALRVDPVNLEGQIFHESQQILKWLAAKNNNYLEQVYITKIVLHYLLSNQDEWSKKASELIGYAHRHKLPGLKTKSSFMMELFTALSYLRAYSGVSQIEKWQYRWYVRKVKKSFAKAAKTAPMNFLHNFYLVSAEEARVLKKYDKAEDLYDKAIQSAEENKYLREQALANELAAKMYIERGKTRSAKAYMTEAYYLYARWGSKAKTRQLERLFADYIDKNSLADRPRVGGSLTTIASIDSLGNSTSINPSALDVASLMKAAQSISGEVEVEKLLQTMMNVVMENAGADRVCFLTKSGNQWLVQASASAGQNTTTNVSMPTLPMQGNVPEAVINVVARTQEMVLLADAQAESQFLRDAYIQERKPQSVLCLPLQHQGQLVGMLYLENTLVPNVFTPERLEILKLLSAQIAISLDNAKAYQLLEQRVRERTNELHIANEVLHQKNEELEAINTEKSEIMGIVSHDLKNPIGAIRGFAELIEQGYVEGDVAKEMAAQVVETSERMLELVKNLLDINRLEQEGIQFQRIHFDIVFAIESVLSQYRSPAQAKNITLNFHPDQKHCEIFADEQATAQVLDNLISNAVKYSPYGKSIHIRVKSPSSREGHSPLAIGHLSNDNTNAPMTNVPTPNAPMTNDQFLRIEVQDEGPGISQADMKKMFGKFARLSAQPTGGEHSTGLGLSIVKKMVEAMKGRVWCESELGKGATFIVELPCNS